MCHSTLKGGVCDRHLFLGCSEKNSFFETVSSLKAGVYFSDMIKEKGFDVDKYLKVQSEEILKRVDSFEKLYLEFGGKIYGIFMPPAFFRATTRIQK